MERYGVRLEFVEELLGTASADPELYEKFILSKRPPSDDEDELGALPEVEEEIQANTTVFRRDSEGRPILYDYQVKGFFKDACGCLRRVTGTHSNKLKAYRKEIDGLILVAPRQIPIELPAGAELGICERPLRAQTAQGERIALARSETAPAGSLISFEVKLLKPGLLPALGEWLEYGELRGLGQWRNSGAGRFRVAQFEQAKPEAVVA